MDTNTGAPRLDATAAVSATQARSASKSRSDECRRSDFRDSLTALILMRSCSQTRDLGAHQLHSPRTTWMNAGTKTIPTSVAGSCSEGAQMPVLEYPRQRAERGGQRQHVEHQRRPCR
jgi:hypothetical protein